MFLEVQNLHVSYGNNLTEAVGGVSFGLHAGDGLHDPAGFIAGRYAIGMGCQILLHTLR